MTLLDRPLWFVQAVNFHSVHEDRGTDWTTQALSHQRSQQTPLMTVTSWKGGSDETVSQGSLGRCCPGAAHRSRQGHYKTIPRSGSAASETGLSGKHMTRQLMDSRCPRTHGSGCVGECLVVHGGDI